MKIILDTNFLMAVSQFKIDIFQELKGHELYIIDAILAELKKLSKGNSKHSKAALLALVLIENKHLKTLPSKKKSADNLLIMYSKKGYVIATQDRILRNKIKKAGGKSIYIRQRKYVIL